MSEILTMKNRFEIKPIESQWLALYTKGRHEKSVDMELNKKGIESFLPLRKIKRRWSDRVVTVEEPLFKSYVFVKTGGDRVSDVIRTKGAVSFVSVNSRPVFIRPQVIQGLKSILESEMAVDPFPYLNAGSRVVVKSGIFKGIEGFIVRKDQKRCRLVISIDALMVSISVEVDSALVEKV